MFKNELEELFSKRNYPCVAALQAFRSSDYVTNFYGTLGLGQNSNKFAEDLAKFIDHQKDTGSIYATFFAVFNPDQNLSEDEFEKAMWQELSFLSQATGGEKNWDPKFSSNPQDKNFCFSLNKKAFFIVGLHPNSSRLARRLSRPTIVFNLYEQFEDLHRKGQYLPMIKTIRARDIKFQGSVNPMIEQHSDQWEAIQFSGKANSPNWKCPFHHLVKNETQI